MDTPKQTHSQSQQSEKARRRNPDTYKKITTPKNDIKATNKSRAKSVPNTVNRPERRTGSKSVNHQRQLSDSSSGNRPKRSPSSELNNRPKQRPDSASVDRTKHSPSSELNNRPKQRPNSASVDRTKHSPSSELNNRPKQRPDSASVDRTKHSPSSELNNRPKQRPDSASVDRTKRGPSSELNNRPKQRPDSASVDRTKQRPDSDFNNKPKQKPVSGSTGSASDIKKHNHKQEPKQLSVGTIIGRIFILLGTTVGILLLFIVLVLFIVMNGPSKEARRLFTLSSNETSAMKWLPGLFMSEEDLQSILNPTIIQDDYVELAQTEYLSSSDDSVENISTNSEGSEASETAKDFEIVDIKGATYKGKLLIIKDPSKVAFVSIDSFGGTGIVLSKFLTKYDAIACTNAGGFEDEGGKGKGGTPDGIVIRDGKIVYGSAGGFYTGFAGFDANNKLHVGNMSGQEALNRGIVNGTCFANGPILIKDGVRQSGFVSGINPRTCIGQTADGTVLLAAVEGRLPDSLGATFEDLTNLMESYGAINAANMDGGSSSGMYYEGERITRSCSVIGDRPIPTAIVVFR